MRNKHIILVMLAILIATVPFALYSNLGEDEGYFTGADDKASEIVKETGYTPWFNSIWEAPSGEIESLLFAIQAAIGSFIIAYIFGYWHAKSKYNKKQ
ncbi:MAG: energy-coupling factor ABC transporter substrate-binding protein [Methanobacteriaceae archaeon]